MVLQARAYPGFLSLKGLGALPLPPGWELVHPKGTSLSPPPPSISASFSLQGWSTFKIFGEIVLSISLQNIWLPSWIFNAEGDRGENEISREGVDSACRGRKTKKGGPLSYSRSNMANQLTINSLLDQWALSSMGKTSALFKRQHIPVYCFKYN